MDEVIESKPIYSLEIKWVSDDGEHMVAVKPDMARIRVEHRTFLHEGQEDYLLTVQRIYNTTPLVTGQPA